MFYSSIHVSNKKKIQETYKKDVNPNLEPEKLFSACVARCPKSTPDSIYLPWDIDQKEFSSVNLRNLFNQAVMQHSDVKNVTPQLDFLTSRLTKV